jgi:hypothetical protein
MSSRQAPDPFHNNDVDQLRLELRRLERRLKDGEEQVGQAKQDGDYAFVDRYEPAWIRLLYQYERLYDRLTVALGQVSLAGPGPTD